VSTFNVNQFSTPAHEKADLAERMKASDVVLCQETVNLDLVAFTQGTPDWRAFQIRHGDSDGHANTAVLSRIALSGGTRVTDEVLLNDTKGLRRRFLAAEKLQGVWYASAHINPQRFAADIPTQLTHLAAWLKAHPGPAVIGLDKNQASVGALEHATGLTWHGVGIDGFLTNLPMKAVASFAKGFSDHPGVHALVTTKEKPLPAPKAHPLHDILAALRAALAGFKKAGAKRRAKRTQAAIDALKPKPVKPKPPKPQPVPVVPHGFMPGAIVKAIPPGANDPAIDPCGVIQHIAVSNADSLFPLFTSDNGIESHFYILKDGTIEQYRSIFFEADAQNAGNSFGSPRRGFVSVEHEGGVGADLGQPMPQAQLDAFHNVIKFVHSLRPFRLRVCPAWNAEGVGYHALFDQWNTNHHSCPGAARIKQFNEVTVPWLKAGGK
jgi:hypothetical protein